MENSTFLRASDLPLIFWSLSPTVSGIWPSSSCWCTSLPPPSHVSRRKHWKSFLGRQNKCNATCVVCVTLYVIWRCTIFALQHKCRYKQMSWLDRFPNAIWYRLPVTCWDCNQPGLVTEVDLKSSISFSVNFSEFTAYLNVLEAIILYYRWNWSMCQFTN